jgi:type I restriction enzyme S subunit
LATCSKKGATVESIVLDKLRALQIPLPSLKEQERIVEILDQADALRRQRREADELSKRIIPAIFHEMFGDPSIRGQQRLGGITQMVGGGTPSKRNSSFWEGDIPWASPKDVKGVFLRSTQDRISAQAVSSSATRVVPTGTPLVVVRSGILAHTFPVVIAATETAINQDLKGFLSDQEGLQEYLTGYIIANQELVLSTVKKGATVHNVDMTKFQDLPIVEPSASQLKAFRRIFWDYFQRLDQGAQSNKLLETLFQTLLHRAFDGSLTASWREAHAAELLQEMEGQSS